MKKMINLETAKRFWETTSTTSVIETDTTFLINKFGKYHPNITFVVDKSGFIDEKGDCMDPLLPIESKDIWYSSNLIFDGEPMFLFGDFWRSRKGGACFRPKDPSKAKHILCIVNWGGTCDTSRGQSFDEAREQAGSHLVYFRKASSNGRGVGTDYWVIPVGFSAYRYDPGFDGPKQEPDYFKNEQRIRETYQAKFDEIRQEKEALYKASQANLSASRKNRVHYEPRLLDMQKRLDTLTNLGTNMRIPSLHLQADVFGYAGKSNLYCEESIIETERAILSLEAEVHWYVRVKKEQKEAHAFWKPVFDAFLKETGHEDTFICATDDYYSIQLPFLEKHILYSGEGYKELQHVFKL